MSLHDETATATDSHTRDPITLRVVEAHAEENDGRYRVLVEAASGERSTVIMSEAILDAARRNNNTLVVKPSSEAFREQRPHPRRSRRHSHHRLCTRCRMVNTHTKDCDALDAFMVDLPRRARAPHADAPNAAWVAFFRSYPDVMAAVLNLPATRPLAGAA